MKNIIERVKTSFQESYDELIYKVSWPTAAELSSSAVVVMVASVIIALVVFAMDFSFEHVIKMYYEAVS